MSTPLLPSELGRLGARELLINETFRSIQGESTFAGRLCFFIRLTGCHLRCTWCDSEYSFHEGQRTTVDACVELARAASLPLVEVTGGEPLLQKAVHPLLKELADAGFEVLLETSGALSLEAIDRRVRAIVDWKAPASGMVDRNAPRVIETLRPGDELKFVLVDRADYDWSVAELSRLQSLRDEIGATIPVHFSPVFGRLDPRQLVDWTLEDRLPVRVNLQLHKLIWPPDTRGV